MPKKIKNWVISFFILWGFCFLLLTKYHIQVIRNDSRYDSIGLNLENTVDQNIANKRALKSDKGLRSEIIKGDLSLTPLIYGSTGSLENINNYIVAHSRTQEEINNSVENKSLIFQRVEIDDNFKVNLFAVPFTIMNIKNNKYYPDDHVIVKKGKVGVNKYTYINTLIHGEIISKPQIQIQYLGTKKYIKIPDLDKNKSVDYLKKFKSKHLKVNEHIVNNDFTDKYKKVFSGYVSLEQIKSLHKDEKVNIYVKWLSKKQYSAAAKYTKLQELELKAFKKWRKLASERISNFKYFDDNDKTEYLNLISNADNSKTIKKIYKKALKIENRNAARNGIGSGKFIPPVQPATMTAGVDWHLQNEGVHAIDFSPPGSYPGSHKIVASDSGVIIKASEDGPYGNCVVIDHKNGYFTRYGHLNSFTVNVGDIVVQGDQIGWIGTTGNSTGTHVHFEIGKGNIQNTIDERQFGLGY